MKNNATRTIRSEEITIDVRICAALAANRGCEVYLAAIAPDMELTITPLANVRSYLPCFDETDSCYSISEDVPLALCYDPRQVITLAGKRYLSGAVVFVRYDTNGNFVALTTSDLYLIQCYLAENSVPLMAGREKMVCICID